MNKRTLTQSLCWGLALGTYAAERPNVVLINIDDLGWADFSFNGSSYYETPNIDKLKHAGIWFSQAYAGAPNSAPSRACMLTGQNTPRHGIYTVANPDRGKSKDRKLIPIPNREALPDGFQILPQVLHDAGYQTFHLGKWHVTSNPRDCGFDVNVGGFNAGHPRSYFSPYHNPNLEDGEKGEFLCDRLGDEAVKLIKNAEKSRPYFMYFATYAVHTPLQAKADDIAYFKRKKGNGAHNNPTYAALIKAMDENVGKVLRAIEESGESANTIIIFTTDNGGVYNISKQWPLRAGKGSFYEGGIRVPIIVYQPGVYEKQEIHDVAVSQLDLFPTIMDMTDLPTKNLLLDGKSLEKVLRKGSDKQLANRPIFYHFPAYLEGGNKETTDELFRTRPVSVVRQGDWKLIENYETGFYELYNLKEDLGEKHNLVNIEKKKVKELASLLNRWKRKTKAPIPSELNPDYQGN